MNNDLGYDPSAALLTDEIQDAYQRQKQADLEAYEKHERGINARVRPDVRTPFVGRHSLSRRLAR